MYPDRFDYMKEPDINLNIWCTEYEKYNMICNTLEYYKKQAEKCFTKRVDFSIKKTGLDRKKYLSALKTRHIKKFFEDAAVNAKKYICFCGSIDQANQLSPNILHSKISNKKQVLEAFKQGEINNLFVVNMLKEGVNIPGIEACVITQLDRAELDFIQKVGRALRNPDDPEVYIFYYRDTKDEFNLNNVLYEYKHKT